MPECQCPSLSVLTRTSRPLVGSCQCDVVIVTYPHRRRAVTVTVRVQDSDGSDYSGSHAGHGHAAGGQQLHCSRPQRLARGIAGKPASEDQGL